MITLEIRRANEMLAAELDQWIVYLLFTYDFDRGHDIDTLIEAVKVLSMEQHSQILVDGEAVLIFQSEEEARQFYRSLPQEGSSAPDDYWIYARLISPTEGTIDENT